jgi:hypothetical protein
MTNLYGIGAATKTALVLIVFVGNLLGWSFATAAVVRIGDQPLSLVVALVNVGSSWLTYGLLRARRKAAVFAAGVPIALSLVETVRAANRSLDIGNLVLGIAMLVILLRSYEHLD